LGGGDHLREYPIIDIDPVTLTMLKSTHNYNLMTYRHYDTGQLANDVTLISKLYNTEVENVVKKIKRNEKRLSTLKRSGIQLLGDMLLNVNARPGLLLAICKPALHDLISAFLRLTYDQSYLDQHRNGQLYSNITSTWVDIALLESSKIRELIIKQDVILLTKLMPLTIDDATTLYSKIKKISSIQLRTKILRLIHGDVYCGTRLVKFKMSDNDRCVRCFEAETIEHLLVHCPYSREVWNRLGILAPTPGNIIDSNLTVAELEVRAAIVDALVFRKGQCPPSILVKNIYKSYSNRRSRNITVTRYAQCKLNHFDLTGAWHY